MWDELREQVTLERELLHLLLDKYDVLLQKCEHTPPDDIEVAALAVMLHAFYNGAENILKRLAQDVDGSLPTSEFWHRDLLDAMARPTASRRSVISSETHRTLKGYLQFRHMFRHTYTFDLRWERMKPLLLGCADTLRRFEAELDRFLDTLPSMD